jgi:hypothetical protein
MPTPEHFGLASDWSAGPIDWNAVMQQARRLGATDFHLSRLPQGGYQVSLRLPAGATGQTRRVEASGETEAEAVRAALQQAEQP